MHGHLSVRPDHLFDQPSLTRTHTLPASWMFDCARVPAFPSDYSVTYAKEGSTGDEGHIVVFRLNRPWKIDCFDHGRLLSTAELERYCRFSPTLRS
jgi:carnitine O-acetyltransferase